MSDKQYCVYILTNPTHTVLYTGVTSNLPVRVQQHRDKAVPGFTAKYNCVKLIFHETTTEVESALVREKQIKGWTRAKKIGLIESVNPEWKDLSDDLSS